MRGFITPQNPFEEFEVGCLRVYYPDNPLLFSALMGHLSLLETRWIWNTDGDLLAAEKLEQDWFEAGELTRATSGDECLSIEDIQQELEDCQEKLREYEDMDITVNCNCGCCPGVSTPVIVDETNTDVDTVVVNVDPKDPFGEDLPEFDPVLETPPDGWETWQEFVDDRCLVSNYGVDAFFDVVDTLDTAVNKASIGADVMDVASILILLVPLPVGKVTGVLKVAKWVLKIAAGLRIFSEGIEELNDWLQVARDSMEPHRDELKCIAYNAASVEGAVGSMVTILRNALSAWPALSVLTTAERGILEDIMVNVMEDVAPIIWNGAARFYVPDGYTPSLDCSECESGEIEIEPGFFLVPATLLSVAPYPGSGVSNMFGNILAGNVAELIYDANNSGQTARLDVEFEERPSLDAGEEWIGFSFSHLDEVGNIDGDFGISPPTDPDAFMTNGFDDMTKDMPWVMSQTGSGLSASIAGYNRLDHSGFSLSDVTKAWTGLTARSGQAGTLSVKFNEFYWVKKVAA